MSNNINDAVQAVNALATKIEGLITETTNADNRFEAKLAGLQAQIIDLQAQITAGADTTPVVTALNDLATKVDNATASQQVSGI